MSRPPRVLLGVSGGIAAYKAPDLVRAFRKAGIEVQVVVTVAASAFVSELALATVSQRPVRRELFDLSEETLIGHIELATWADVIVVAPATADVMARAAHGLANDLLATCLLATRAPVLWAPAMNTNMWRHPATVANLETLAGRGHHFVGPDRGDLACGWVGEGRMIDPPDIVAAARRLLDEASASNVSPSDGMWRGRRVLVSAGPTRAYLDPVRYFTNASTGEMGFSLAQAACARGAEVTLVSGPVERATPPGVRRIDVETAEQMLSAMEDVIVREQPSLVAMVAAVSDLAPASEVPLKLEKAALLDALAHGALVQGVDVLATLVQRHGSRCFFLGFAAQTVADDTTEVDAELVRAAQEKLARKGCHALFVNRVGVPGVGFGSPTNTGLLLVRAGGSVHVEAAGAPRPKLELAGWILNELRDKVAAVSA